MANRFRGEVSFKSGEETYTLRYDANTLCEVEDAFDMGVNKIATLLQDQEKLRLSHIRLVFHLGLKENHPNLSLEDAGRLISEVGMGEAAELFARAFSASFPDPQGGNARPPVASRNGTGSPSSQPTSKPVLNLPASGN